MLRSKRGGSSSKHSDSADRSEDKPDCTESNNTELEEMKASITRAIAGAHYKPFPDIF